MSGTGSPAFPVLIPVPSLPSATLPLGSTDLIVVSQNGVGRSTPYLATVIASLASPGPIGSTTPNTGAFTSLTSTSGALNGSIGATTPSTGAFTSITSTTGYSGPVAATTLSASGAVSGAGFTSYMASPPAIGGTAAAAGSFTALSSTSGAVNAALGGTTPAAAAVTTLAASGTVSGAGFVALHASPGPIGNTTPSTGAFTSLSATTLTLTNALAVAQGGTGGTSASAARTNLSAAASGANGDITSLTGLTTPLSGAQGGTGVANISKTITIGGNVTHSGAFTTTIIVTANTSVTLPTSGTLLATVVQAPGSATNDSANAGNLGEYISSTVTAGAPVGISSSTSTNVTSISLTAGDWDLWGVIIFQVMSVAATTCQAWMNTVSATPPTLPNGGGFNAIYSTLSAGTSIPCGPWRLSLASTTTVYLTAFATFSGASNVIGFIGARRRR
jgi:hypothetical protein